jgi:UDP-3-O-acyl N-acetylglucosamine deacetylase
MRTLGYRYQRTLARSAEVCGVGYLTGATVRLRFHPAPPSSGVVFVRSDLGAQARLAAVVENVTGTNRRTTLGRPPLQVSLVEHVLATLAGLKIDNCLVELNAPEPPGLDGSAWGFVEAVRSAGAVLQSATRQIWCVDEPLTVTQDGATLTLHPGSEPGLRVSYLLDYGLFSPIDWQTYTQTMTPENFANEVASCRTFLLQEEADALQAQGLGSRTTPRDLLIFGKRGPVENTLRFANEPARHKVLDIMGDLSLFGADLQGHVVAYRSGHPLNIALVQKLRQPVRAAGCRAVRQAA